MTPTEVFFLFLKKSLTPNERLAFTREIRAQIRKGNAAITNPIRFREDIPTCDVLEKTFAERIIWNSYYIRNSLGIGGYSSTCSSLTSFMKYLLFYMPNIVGDSRNKNKYLEREIIHDTNRVGYRNFWNRRLIKKWHDFLMEYIINGRKFFYYRFDMPDYKLRGGAEL